MDSTPPDEIAALCLLLRAPGIGTRTLEPLLTRTGSARALVDAPPPDAPSGLRDYLRSPDWSAVEPDLEWLQKPDRQLLRPGDPAWPAQLSQIADPPLALFAHGDPELLGLPTLAIVGSRTPSSGGRRTAHAFAGHLADSGLVIASGLASGIDAAAHQGALSVHGQTLAVTGTGLDRVYPAQNRELAHKIAADGVLISEFPLGTPPLPANFPRRNRILAALSLGTLVVEAALKSGSLITARLAAESGREVFAIPGSIHNPLSRGCHALIRDGAKLVESAEHVLEELAPQLGEHAPPLQASPAAFAVNPPPTPDPQHQQVLEALGFDPATTDELVERTGFRAAEISSILLLLELQGHVSSGAGGMFTRLGNRPE